MTATMKRKDITRDKIKKVLKKREHIIALGHGIHLNINRNIEQNNKNNLVNMQNVHVM